MSEQPQNQRIDTPPDAQRQAELDAAYQQNLAAGNAPYAGVKIVTYGELCWIFQQRHWSGDMFLPEGMGRPNLSEAHLRKANLSEASLDGANLSKADLFGANLSRAFLGEANLSEANLGVANLSGAHLGIADLGRANLSGANLSGAYLSGAKFDSDTLLEYVGLSSTTRLGDIRWNGVDVTRIDWQHLRRLGDDTDSLAWSYNKARANRQIATLLRSQGINNYADRFAYRANMFERQANLSRNPLSWFPWLGSLLLDGVAGYGYKSGRILFWYLVTITGFTFMYMKASEGWVPFGLPMPTSLPRLPWYEALILSVSSFHGRGFFQPVQSLGDPIAALAAIEAVVGLFIEASFIATFTQRFFGK